MMGFPWKQLFTSYLCRVRQKNLSKPIQEGGCEAKVIQNGRDLHWAVLLFLYSSGTRPRKDLTDKRVKYCDTCKPSLRSWTKVSLNCPGTKHPRVDKLVEVIYDCTCP